ncbi:hypothetical protein HAX54_004886, partial [Datura stramonium]|nr:hypothetical protein [Datura stramonium]
QETDLYLYHRGMVPLAYRRQRFRQTVKQVTAHQDNRHLSQKFKPFWLRKDGKPMDHQ